MEGFIVLLIAMYFLTEFIDLHFELFLILQSPLMLLELLDDFSVLVLQFVVLILEVMVLLWRDPIDSTPAGLHVSHLLLERFKTGYFEGYLPNSY